MRHSFGQAWAPTWMLLAATAMAGPVNDQFADRIVLSGELAQAVGSTVGGTREEGEPQTFHVLSTVWYEWVAPRSGSLRVQLLETEHTLIAHLHTGDALGALSRVGMIWSPQPEVNLAVQEGARYQFQIGPDQPVPFPRFEGPFTLRLELNTPPPNDHFTNRIQLTNPIERITCRNVLATQEPGETPLSWQGGSSVWYEWRAPETGVASMIIDNSHGTAVGIFDIVQGALGPMLTNNQFNAGNCWLELSFPAVQGGAYALMFDSCGATRGPHAATLTINGAARLGAPRRRADGVMEMTLYGHRYRSYIWQASDDLVLWTALSTHNYYEPVTLEDPAAAGKPRRFYRVQLQP